MARSALRTRLAPLAPLGPLARLAAAAALAQGLALPARAAGPDTAAAAAPRTVQLTLLGVGDIYNFDGDGHRGGFARLNAVARAERAAHPDMLYVFDGDMLSPSLLSGLDHGQNTIDMTNLVPFDIAVPGNHEFDFGPQNFAAKMRDSRYPWAAINITRADGTALPGLGGVMWKTIAGLRIALIPVAQDTSPEVSDTGDLKFLGTVATGIAAARAARAEGADLVIGVVQTDRDNDDKLIASHAFDVILSGDDHLNAMYYDGITAYVETSIDARFLQPVDLTIEVAETAGKRVIRWTPAFRWIDTAAVTPDPATEALIRGYRAKLDATLGEPIGKVTEALDSRRNIVRSEESSMADLIADALLVESRADLVILNGGGIRGDRVYEPGTVLTRKDVLTELPFGNKTVVTALPGRQILAALENGFSQAGSGAGRFPQIAGLNVVWDPSAPPMHRVVSLTRHGKPLAMDQVYKVATNDYLLDGGDGYAALGGGRVIVGKGDGNLMTSDVIAHVRRLGTVSIATDGRLRPLGH